MQRAVRHHDVSTTLTGWKQIAEFLGQPVATAQHWGKEGMPVSREGRYVVTSTAELSAWLGRIQQRNEPVYIAARGGRDLTAEVRRGLIDTRRRKRLHRIK
jgi:phage terminase Nu1 subunit (DNA packaging protein)